MTLPWQCDLFRHAKWYTQVRALYRKDGVVNTSHTECDFAFIMPGFSTVVNDVNCNTMMYVVYVTCKDTIVAQVPHRMALKRKIVDTV